MKVFSIFLYVQLCVFKTTFASTTISSIKSTINSNYVNNNNNSNNNILKYCTETFVHIFESPLLTTNCCLTKLCSNSIVFQQMIRDHPAIKRLSFQLCNENFYLARELLTGCVFDDKLNIKINKDDNHHQLTSDKDKVTYRLDYNENSQLPFVTRKTEEINSRIIDDSKMKLKRILFESIAANRTSHKINALLGKDKEIRLQSLTKISARISGLQFLEIPAGDEMHIHDLKLDEEYLLFDVFSLLVGYLLPDGFPIELLKQIINNHLPIQLVVLQMVKTEIILDGWIIFWTLLTICIPCILCAHLCCPRSRIRRLEEVSSETSENIDGRCTEPNLTILLHILLLLLLFPIILILIANEQISRQLARSVEIVDITFNDLNTFVRNTHMQMAFVTTSSTDITIEAIRKDLENVEGLVGRPFQEELATETGINIALENLDGVKYATSEMATLVSELLDECLSAHAAGSLLQEQLREIAAQLTIARQHCLPKDRALCYTLQYTGLDVVFSCDNLTSDAKIKQLERMKKEKAFNNSIENAKDTFQRLPLHVSGKAAIYVSDIKDVLSKKRTDIYKSTHCLDELARSISYSITTTHEKFGEVARTIVKWDLWRWSIILGISIVLILIWSFIMCGSPCGDNLTSRTALFLTLAVCLSSLICFVVWTLGNTSLLLGSHINSLICRPLYDRPHYKTLGEVFDFDGVLYRTGDGGIFNAFVKGNSSIRIRDILNGCERNHPVYTTFRLKNSYDLQSLTNYKLWNDFRMVTANFSIADIPLEILSPSLQLNLQFLSTISSVNFTKYRLKMSASVTKRDLNSIADQLTTVARQMNDLIGSRRIENLVMSVKKIIKEEYKRLNDLRDSILYKITALQVLMYPLSRQANQSLAHLKTIQYYLDNQGWQIANRNSQRFTSKIENYLADLQDHILSKIMKDLGRCKPLWEVFYSTRFCICDLIMDPLNGISCCCFLLILFFLSISVVSLKLVERYKDLNEEILTSITHRRSRDGLIIDDEGTWASPTSETSPEMEMHVRRDETSAWAISGSRQPSSEPLIPPPPRPLSGLSSRITSPKSSKSASRSKLRSPKRLSTIASRITAARVPQMPSVSRARSPKRGKHESLRLIEPICWKTG